MGVAPRVQAHGWNAVILPTLGWRWLLVFSVLPLLFSLAATCALQESPEWLLVSGQTERAHASRSFARGPAGSS